MNDQWFVFWMMIVFLFVVTPMGYGWGYRSWGPPYPRYIQKRRHQKNIPLKAGAISHLSWGWTGDFVWFTFVVFLGILFWGMWMNFFIHLFKA